MEKDYEELLKENSALLRALNTTKHKLERMTNDFDTLKEIHDELKNQYDKVQKENTELTHRYLMINNEKKELESRFDTTIRNLKISIEQKQKEMEDMNAKIVPSFDYDMLKFRTLNELEIPHKMQLESKQQEIDKLTENTYEYKRQLELLQAKYDSLKTEGEKDIKALKDRYKIEIGELHSQIESLHDRIEDTRDKDQIRIFRRENEDLKSRLNEKDAEIDQVRLDLEKAKEDRNGVLIKMSKQLDNEKNDRRQARSDAEKAGMRVRFLEEENKKQMIKLESIVQKFENMEREKYELSHNMSNKEEKLNMAQRKIADLEEELSRLDVKYQEKITAVYAEEQEKLSQERSRAHIAQKEIENLKRDSQDLVDDKDRTINRLTRQLEELKREVEVLQNERFDNKNKLANTGKDFEKLEQDIEVRNIHIEELEKELESLKVRYKNLVERVSQQENYRETGSNYYEQRERDPGRGNRPPNSRESIERGAHEQNIKNVGFYDNKKENNKENNSSNIAEIKRLRKKNKVLKDNLKKANSKIMDLLSEKMNKLSVDRLANPNIHQVASSSKGMIFVDDPKGRRETSGGAFGSTNGLSTVQREGELIDYQSLYNKASRDYQFDSFQGPSLLNAQDFGKTQQFAKYDFPTLNIIENPLNKTAGADLFSASNLRVMTGPKIPSIDKTRLKPEDDILIGKILRDKRTDMMGPF